ncbi:MAG: hypothetical protein OIF58_10145 [Cohaesibacter sp.]|nr:hypothetical protein [Cohaesibacter sp.]
MQQNNDQNRHLNAGSYAHTAQPVQANQQSAQQPAPAVRRGPYIPPPPPMQPVPSAPIRYAQNAKPANPAKAVRPIQSAITRKKLQQILNSLKPLAEEIARQAPILWAKSRLLLNDLKKNQWHKTAIEFVVYMLFLLGAISGTAIGGGYVLNVISEKVQIISSDFNTDPSKGPMTTAHLTQ